MEFFIEIFPIIMEGVWVTIKVSTVGALVALAVAVVAGSARASNSKMLRTIAGIYVEVFRGTSALVQMFWIYFVLPLPPFNLSLTAFQAGALALGLNVGAYMAEVVRGGINAVDKGQIEASIALNMTPMLRLRRVILPQALVRILPPVGNLLIDLLKLSSLVSLITLSDMTLHAFQLRPRHFSKTPQIFIMLLLLYFILTRPITWGIRWIENKRQWA
jgi:polar amino acid transport system permease protein